MRRSHRIAGDPSPRVVLAPGGSAGHVAVAVAIAEAMAQAWPDARLRVLGAGGVLEERLLAATGLPFDRIPAAPFRRQGLAGKLAALLAAPRARRAAREALVDFRPQLVVGTGAYASVPAVLAARALGAAVVLHEANAGLGLANRVLAPLADALLVGELWNGRNGDAPGKPHRSGTPVRLEVRDAAAKRAPAEAARPARLLVTAGAEGSPFLDAAGPRIAAILRRQLPGGGLHVRHQTGHGDASAVRARYADAGVAAEVDAYLQPFAASYTWTDAVVCAAGASTLAELAALALPALVVPVGSVAGNHQERNARRFAELTGAPWRTESAWRDEDAAASLAPLLRDPAARQALADRARQARLPRAEARVVERCAAALAAREARGRDAGLLAVEADPAAGRGARTLY